MNRHKPLALLVTLVLAGGALGACGDDGGEDASGVTEPATETTSAAPTRVTVGAKDFGWDVPATFKGGLVELAYSNTGKEPHFAAFAKVADGKSYADVKAALTAPPSSAPPAGPPPFTDVVGFPTGDPGTTISSATVNFPAGTYALYCLIPSPSDGKSHAAKGMVTEVTVTQGADGPLPASLGPVKAVDFGFDTIPPLKSGTNVIGLRNDGKQLHEINLIALQQGKTMNDVAAWFNTESGPPPMSFLAGVAVAPGATGAVELDLKPGTSYAFICAIPDFLGDFKPHVTKGMRTGVLTVA